MTDTVIRKSLYLNATPEQVWAYLTDPEKLALWFHKPTTRLEQGNDLKMYGAESGNLLIWGTVNTARRPEYLEYTFTIAPMGDAVSLVKWTLEEVADGTRLSLEHSGLPQGAEAFGLTLNLDKGWDEHIGRMRALLLESA
ncbi:SRPBCC family protein [Sedimentitalea todarodis]|uniref:SRPBCC domain-containing protein n=1 Tax=Sedimentitalea todarodis TaxID=1631240 RepID=A0ABU3VBD9_9RHOB|nr:SRPBCC domain-containing protein [Sedimentitalea todarodis]MDU9003492.1 SRPBCC domain-containing protein [Sedimentitalea todarodis]